MQRLLLSDSILGMFLQVVPITCLVGLIYAILRIRYIKGKGRVPRWGTEVLRLLFVCYLTGLVNLTLVPNNLWTAIWYKLFHGGQGCVVGPLFTMDVNLVPTLYQWWRGELLLGSWVRTMLAGNALMLVPMGIFLPLVFPCLRKRALFLLAVGIPLAMELLQPILGRAGDVDDLVMNFIGILIGCLIAWPIKRLFLQPRVEGA